MNKLLYDKLATIYFFLFTFNTLSTALALAFANSEWRSMSPTTRFVTVSLIVQSWTGTMLAFVNKAANRVAKDEPLLPVDTGNTSIITKADVKTISNPPVS